MTQKQGKINYLIPSTLGMGRGDGYEGMEVSQHLCKPMLRRETEEKLGLVAQAQISKQETVSQSLQEYKTIFGAVKSDFTTVIQVKYKNELMIGRGQIHAVTIRYECYEFGDCIVSTDKQSVASMSL